MTVPIVNLDFPLRNTSNRAVQERVRQFEKSAMNNVPDSANDLLTSDEEILF